MSSTRYTGFSATIAMALAVSLSARSPQLTEDFNQTIAFPSGGLLELRNFSGDVRLTGTTRRDAVIKAVRRGNREELDHIRLEVRTTANGVAIDANRRDPGWDRRRNDTVDTTFDIELPASASLDIETFSSQLDIRGVSGPLVVKTFSGDIDVDATAAGASPEITARTFSGDIRARLAEGAKREVCFNSFSGRFESRQPVTLCPNGRGRTTSNPPASSASGRLNFDTFSGNVTIEGP
jgi:Toastrack DUF4097